VAIEGMDRPSDVFFTRHFLGFVRHYPQKCGKTKVKNIGNQIIYTEVHCYFSTRKTARKGYLLQNASCVEEMQNLFLKIKGSISGAFNASV